MKRRIRPLVIILLILILGAGAYILFFQNRSLSSRSDYVPYKSFSAAIDSNEVEKATLESDRISFVMEGKAYVTENPHSDTLTERLLSTGAAVDDNSDFSVTSVLDIVFDVIFLGAVAFGLYKLLQYSNRTFKVVHSTGVRFEDIAGMDNIKKDMAFLVDVLKNPQKYEGRLRPVKGVILEGPPGNGKTLFAKALANETDVNFIATKGADFQSALMSMSARKLKMLFNKARRHRPCIVFIDEFDSIGERRNYAGTGIDKENNRLITTMLNEMDGFVPYSGLLVIAATNSYASLDPALIRPGRFDLKYTIGNPDQKTRARLVEIYSKGKSLSADLTEDFLVGAFEGQSCAAIEAVLNEAQSICQMENSSEITTEILVAASQKTGTKLNIRNRK